MTNELLFEISEQPEDTCPMLDDALHRIDKTKGAIDGYQRSDDVEELRGMCENVDYYGDDPREHIERARDNVTAIREWGQEWKNVALKMGAVLRYYADRRIYEGPNRPPVGGLPWTVDPVEGFLTDVTRDGGERARSVLPDEMIERMQAASAPTMAIDMETTSLSVTSFLPPIPPIR